MTVGHTIVTRWRWCVISSWHWTEDMSCRTLRFPPYGKPFIWVYDQIVYSDKPSEIFSDWLITCPFSILLSHPFYSLALSLHSFLPFPCLPFQIYLFPPNFFFLPISFFRTHIFISFYFHLQGYGTRIVSTKYTGRSGSRKSMCGWFTHDDWERTIWGDHWQISCQITVKDVVITTNLPQSVWE